MYADDLELTLSTTSHGTLQKKLLNEFKLIKSWYSDAFDLANEQRTELKMITRKRAMKGRQGKKETSIADYFKCLVVIVYRRLC